MDFPGPRPVRRDRAGSGSATIGLRDAGHVSPPPFAEARPRLVGTPRSRRDPVDGIRHGIRGIAPAQAIASFLGPFIDRFACTRRPRPTGPFVPHLRSSTWMTRRGRSRRPGRTPYGPLIQPPPVPRKKPPIPAASGDASPDPFPIDRPGLVDVLADFAHSSAWEALRNRDAPATAAELASALDRPAAAVQRTLDALERVGLVRRIGATARARRIRYEVTVRKIVMHWDPANPAHRAIHGRLGHAFERTSAAHLAAALPYDQRDPAPGYIDRRMFWGHFEREDLEQVKAIVGMLDLLMSRVNARHARGSRQGRIASCNYHVSFGIVPIQGDFPPPALMQVDGRQNTPYARRHRAATAFDSLTAREREVFDQLLTGRALDEIARELGVARPTVATMARHCYRKFGVSGRQELAAAALGLGRA